MSVTRRGFFKFLGLGAAAPIAAKAAESLSEIKFDEPVKEVPNAVKERLIQTLEGRWPVCTAVSSPIMYTATSDPTLYTPKEFDL